VRDRVHECGPALFAGQASPRELARRDETRPCGSTRRCDRQDRRRRFESSTTVSPAAKRAAISAVSASLSATIVLSTQRLASSCSESIGLAAIIHRARKGNGLWRG
jgi:hypothetical protein